MNNILTKLAELSNATVSSDTNTNAGAAGALIVFFIFAMIFILASVVFVFWVMSLIHLIQHEDVKDRTLWIVLLFLVGGIIGPVYHFAVRKPYEKQQASSSKKSKS